MGRQRIQFDLSRSRNRTSQRTNEASLIVGHGTTGRNPQISVDKPKDRDTEQPKLTINTKPVEVPEAALISALSESSTIPQLSVKFHEDRTSTQNVLVDVSTVPGAREGQVGELKKTDRSKNLYFIFTSDTTQPGMVSIKSGPIPKLMDLKLRTPVTIQVKAPEDVEADVVEIYIKDIHLSRGDMWNLSARLVGNCVYRTQKLGFVNGTIRGDVHRIYRRGRKVFSAYIGERTKVVFRSESARIVVFIQISQEMWHFEESGQQMFYKLVNSLFPKLFKRWKELGTHHLITIVLFTSVDLEEEGQMKYGAGERPPNKEDYYRVVVDQVSILLWNEIMATLRLEFANFKHDILLRHNKATTEAPQEYVIAGNILPAVKGNILEAINLGMSLVTNDFQDPDLRQTTNHFIIMSPGTGLFDVDYNMLSQTGNLLATVDSTIDVICLSQPPLHIVPLFRYLDAQNKPQHCIPNFMDISFWTDTTQYTHQWLPRCKIYELQMMGVMENELTNVTVNELNLSHNRSALDAMADYDNTAFSSPLEQKRKSMRKRRHSSKRTRTLMSGYATIGTHTGSSPHLIQRRAISEVPEPQGFKPELAPTKVSTATMSNVTGSTTTSKSNVSAFSSLLSISKTSSNKMTVPNALNFVKRIIGTKSSESPSLSPVASISSEEETSAMEIPKQQPMRRQSSTVQSFDSRTVRSKRGTIASQKRVTRRSSQIARRRRNVWNDHWTPVDNPSKVNASELRKLVSYGRWRFVFPPNVKRRVIKWTSLASPAALPTTTSLFPTVEDFNQNFTFRIYDVLLAQDEINETRTSESLMRAMVSLRLSLGFQICVGENVKQVEDQRKPNGDSKQLIQYVRDENYEGSRIYLSLSGEIHRISCDYNSLVNVQVYKKINSGEMSVPVEDYVERIRTRYSDVYNPVTIHPSEGEIRNYNWNQLDQVLAGYEDSVETHRYHRMKFVIMPMALPEISFKVASEKLTPEEIRLEGIRSLVATINRNSWRTPEERRMRGKKTEITPEIDFYTGSLFKYLVDAVHDLGDHGNMSGSQLFSAPKFNKTISLMKLTGAMQDPQDGLEIVDRRWHMTTHKNCFIGTDLVSWLIKNFEDIDSREEAVDYGNLLMDKNVFNHVNGKHRFLDGHYFYQINSEYILRKRSTSRSDSERRSTPVLSPLSSIASKHHIDDSVSGVSSSEAEEVPSSVKKVILSRKVLYDLDPNGNSWQQELLNVHYDIVHNPEHCFHIRLEWLNTTSKLIEDAVNSWEKHCERYGLELVETPWEELCTLPERNPLHSTVDITVALDPWKDPEFSQYSDILKENRYFYHLYLLDKCEFMLDNRTANFFRDDKFDVVYSWGRPSFKFAQFIHRTGAYIAELRENGDFFLAPNNAHIARVNLSIGQMQGAHKGTIYFDSQGVMLEFREICQDPSKLRAIFREALDKYKQNDNSVRDTLFESTDIGKN